MIIKDALQSKENVNNILLNVGLVEMLVETVKRCVNVNGCLLCLMLSALLALVSYCLNEQLTWRRLLLYFYNFLIIFLCAVGSYESVIQLITK